MALDEALLRRAARKGEAVLRVYGWTRPSLSLGRNQPAIGLYSAERAAAHGVDVVRRPTGGRALLHHREITYSVTAPLDAAGSLRDAYARINRLLLAALVRLGVPATLAAPSGRAPVPGEAPCFETPVEGELVVGDGKLVGSAQWRDGGALLQHGAILVEDDQPLLHALALHPIPTPPPAATLRGALGRAPSARELAGLLGDAVREMEDAGATALGDDPELARDAEALEARYRSDDWTWRR